jgi:cytidylate kinase
MSMHKFTIVSQTFAEMAAKLGMTIIDVTSLAPI